MRNRDSRELKQQLMLHHDAELDEQAERTIEERLEWDLEAQAYMADLDTLGEGIRGIYQDDLSKVDLTDAIMSRVDGGRLPSAGDRRRWQLTLCSMAALAAATALWIYAGSGADSVLVRSPEGVLDVPARGSVSKRDVTIESVDFGARGGSIFMVQAGEGTTPVVWLSEPEEEVRSEPL